MIHHYLQKGQKLDDLVNLSYAEKIYMKASRDLLYEEERAEYENT